MKNLTYSYAISLAVLGVASYYLTGGTAITALIPSFFGAAILLAGLLAEKDEWRKHAMHFTVLLALLGFLGSASGIPAALDHWKGIEVERPAAAISRAIMAVLSGIYLGFGVKSFIDIRRASKDP